MNTQHTTTDIKPWYKQFWPWFLISLPGAVVVASMFTISIAVENAPVITTNNIGKFVQPIQVEQAKP